MMTAAQLARVQQDYSTYAGEQITVELINQTVYIFGSELATLRLFRKFHNMYEARQSFSVGYQQHFFAFDLRF